MPAGNNIPLSAHQRWPRRLLRRSCDDVFLVDDHDDAPRSRWVSGLGFFAVSGFVARESVASRPASNGSAAFFVASKRAYPNECEAVWNNYTTATLRWCVVPAGRGFAVPAVRWLLRRRKRSSSSRTSPTQPRLLTYTDLLGRIARILIADEKEQRCHR